MKKNDELNEYYITIDDVLNNANYSSDDLGARGVNERVLKDLSRSVYRLIYSVYRGGKPYVHKQFMRLKIENNKEEEQLHLKLAMIEATKGALESGMDFNAYIDNPKMNYPHTVMQELNAARLLDRSEKYL